ncbi:methylthioribose-1-phosphate isomerase-like [Physella acuta]|uniref:methylthioribose-1-phosphate isomerase-like n=1 Tax=Physella acuta TaxID=109671 RepID=UPI0027DB7E0C|nr:methylthioribose-1-phosphate isomerase-like [Physella acuta]XP_059151590.1 methylthioribose-1-phosphate isomerase-like [Physella acuta]XP_059151591.1 methylthioribose-1-phosphate isomerase-like [Physella acuta]
MTLEAIRYQSGRLEILDQLLLPDVTEYISIKNTQDGWKAIKLMQVRGAPAIAIVGCLSLAVELHDKEFSSPEDLRSFVEEQLDYLVSARPTAVNISDAAVKGKSLVARLVSDQKYTTEEIKLRVIKEFEDMLQYDIKVNQSIGHFGAEFILQKNDNQPVNVLTHCNTGSLATAGYGTALGVIRKLHEQSKLEHAYCTETRPYLQGARLTAYELVHEKMNASLICDNMVAALMAEKKIHAVIVGADRVVANGDTANKIGTYQLAVLAKYHQVPFYVACPQTTFDSNLKAGDDIQIEVRPPEELTCIKGIRVAAAGINCWNPAFDVTPAQLITGGIITEFGVFRPEELLQKFNEHSTEQFK